MMTGALTKTVEKAGTKMTKEKLIEAVRNSREKEFHFVRENTSPYVLVKIPLKP